MKPEINLDEPGISAAWVYIRLSGPVKVCGPGPGPCPEPWGPESPISSLASLRLGANLLRSGSVRGVALISASL